MTDFVKGQEQILRKTRDALLLMDENGDILDASAGACELLGYPRGELVNMSLFDLYQHSTIRKERQETFKPILDNGTGTFEARLKSHDGHDFPVRVTAQSLEVEDSSVILAALQDISDEHEEEIALRREAEWLRGALADIGDAMLVLDQEGMVRMASIETVELTGLEVEALEGRPGWEAFSQPEIQDAVNELFQRCMESGEAEEGEIALEMTEETLRLAIISRPIRRNDRIDGCLIRLRDITRETAVLASLEESLDLYHSLVEGAPGGHLPGGPGRDIHVCKRAPRENAGKGQGRACLQQHTRLH